MTSGFRFGTTIFIVTILFHCPVTTLKNVPYWGLNKKRMTKFNWILMFVVFFTACRNFHTDPDLRTAMNTYDRLILKTDGDSIALLYTIDGDLANMAHGRDSIRMFLYRFKDFKVLEQVSTIDSMRIFLDTGFITGSYHQKVIVPNNNAGDTVSVKGNFKSKWILVPEYGWQIKKMETQPIK